MLDIARREIAILTLPMPEDAFVPKSAVVELMVVAFLRGVSWERGIDR